MTAPAANPPIDWAKAVTPEAKAYSRLSESMEKDNERLRAEAQTPIVYCGTLGEAR